MEGYNSSKLEDINVDVFFLFLNYRMVGGTYLPRKQLGFIRRITFH